MPSPWVNCDAASLELVLEHPSVENQVVSDQDGTVQAGCNSTHDFRKGWSSLDHRSSDTAYASRPNIPCGIDQGVVLVNSLPSG